MTAQTDSGMEVLVLRPLCRRTGASADRFDEGHLLDDKRVKFVLTGVLNTAFGFGCFVAYQSLVGARFGYMWTLVLAHVTTVRVRLCHT